MHPSLVGQKGLSGKLSEAVQTRGVMPRLVGLLDHLKIEKAQFYAMFGDYDTGLSVTELGRYSRTLNGFKSEYKGERFGYNAFASVTARLSGSR